MVKSVEDMKADTIAEDRDEPVSPIEPLLIGGGSRHRRMLTDLAFDLTQKSAGFREACPRAFWLLWPILSEP